MNENLEKEIKELKELINKTFIKPQRKALLVVSILLFIYGAFCFLGVLGFSFSGYEKLTEDNTVVFTSTISKIQPIPSYYLQVDGHNASFTIYSADMVDDMDALAALSVGQTITFRVAKDDVEKMNKITNVIELVSLKINSTEIITLESYNKNTDDTGSAPIIILSVIGGLFIFLGIVCVVSYKRKNLALNKTDKEKANENFEVFKN